jgi:hypothetical protein
MFDSVAAIGSAVKACWDSCSSVTKMRSQPATLIHVRVVRWNSYVFFDFADRHSALPDFGGMGTLL